MAVSEEYVAYLQDLYEGKFVLTFKKMFGGMGVYANGLSIGVIAEDVFYGKTDETTRPDFIHEGAGPFTYTAKGKTRTIHSWYEMPDSVMEDGAVYSQWIDRCYNTAVMAAQNKGKKRKKTTISNKAS